jgi:hypothetical protein
MSALTDLETRAVQLGYHYDGLVRVDHPFDQVNPVTWVVVLTDGDGSELTFQADTVEGAVELATDRMSLLCGMRDE